MFGFFSKSNLANEVRKTEQHLENQKVTPNQGMSNFMQQAQSFLETAEKEINIGNQDIRTIDDHISNLQVFKQQRQEDLNLMQTFTNNVAKLFQE